MSTSACAILDYYDLVNHGVFFIADPKERLQALVNAYQSHPKLSLGVASELDGRDFDPVNPSQDSRSFKEALYEGKHPIIQTAMYIEQKARLAVLKAVVDYFSCMQGQSTLSDLSENEQDWSDLSLPSRWSKSASQISRMPGFTKYPVFWQLLLWIWGGFFMGPKKDDELLGIAQQTGMQLGEAQSALSAFDVLFPIDGSSWVKDVKEADCVVIKLVPCPFK